MDNLQFCYWLQGYFEIGTKNGLGNTNLNKEQLEIVRQHIILVEQENPWTCGFIQWLQGVIDTTRVLTLKSADYIKLSKAINHQLTELFEKKTPPFDNNRLEDSTEPLEISPPLFPTLINPNVTCTNLEKSQLEIDLKQDLEDVLEKFSQPTLSPGIRCGSNKKYC